MDSSSSTETLIVTTSNSQLSGNVDVPDELRKALLDFSVAFLMDKPGDVVDYAVNYFSNIQLKRLKLKVGLSLTSCTSGQSEQEKIKAKLAERTFTEREVSYLRSAENRSFVIRSLSDSVALPRSDPMRTDHRVSIHPHAYDEQTKGYRMDTKHKPAESKSVERTSMEPKSGERKSAERTSVERESGERKSTDRTSVERKSGERTSVERKSGERTSVERKSGERKSGERKSVVLKSDKRRSEERTSLERKSKERTSAERGSMGSRSDERRSKIKLDVREEMRASTPRASKSSPNILTTSHYTYEPLPRRKSIFAEAFDTGDVKGEEVTSTSKFWADSVGKATRRKSMFAESFTPNEDDIDYDDDEDNEEGVEKKVKKPPALVRRIRNAIKNVFIFQHLDRQQLRKVVHGMTERHVQPGEVVVEEDSYANNLYVIAEGIYKVYKDDIHVYTFFDEGVFGELALISVRQRLATIVAETNGILWCLDRKTFRHILESKSYYKRQFYERQLRSVYLLQVLPKEKILQLADALQERIYKQGEPIFLQGEKADGLYIVLDGVVQIRARDKKGVEKDIHKIGESQNFYDELALLKIKAKIKTEMKVDIHKIGESQKFFGELGFLKQHTERFTSAYAASHRLKVAFLSLTVFDRIVGDAVNECSNSFKNHPHYTRMFNFYKSLDIEATPM